jgi:isoleucyl-tRNA synthetase
MMDYAETLRLPRTKFPMRANLPQREPEIQRFWEEMGLYKMLRAKSQGRQRYILHDGPPYANGDIHIGHALNKILKDIVVKYKSMQGFDVPYLPGWDCHGLPVEHEVVQNMGRRNLSRRELRRECRKFAARYINAQREQFKRLGVLGDWDNPYKTFDSEYEVRVIEVFSQLMERGFIYRGFKPVHWCSQCKTALAEAEVEYMDKVSPSVYIKFKVTDDLSRLSDRLAGQEVYILVWTTTPWTLPANVAIAINPRFRYSAVRCVVGMSHKVQTLIMAEDIMGTNMAEIGIANHEVLCTLEGRVLEGVKCAHPFIEREVPIVLGDYVSRDEGTGCVHTAPGHGQEDYEVGLKYKLPILSPVDDNGQFTSDVEGFAGLNVFAANEPIIKRLMEVGALLHLEEISHSYPHCWRCKNPVIFRATPQWFISIDKNDLRQRALKAIDQVEWIPRWGMERIRGMIGSRPDWCISRQRAWGVPIPVFHCQECNSPLASHEALESVKSLVSKEGTEGWFARDVHEILPEGFRCPQCGSTNFRKETDILDVWLDSGLSWACVLEKDLVFPADLYLEGSDQHRGWFQSSLLTSMAVKGSPSFRSVLTHGFVMDGRGRKMSKSAGNVIVPQEVIRKFGADILRLWVASEDYREDLRISEGILKQMAEAYRRIRNTCKFMLGNIFDFDPSIDRMEYKELLEIDRWALHSLQKLIPEVTKAYQEFDFHSVFRDLRNFCTIDMSSFYLDILKDRLYTWGGPSSGRRAAQSVLYEILDVLVRLMAPLLAFTAEEIYQQMPHPGQSIHLNDWPKVDESLLNPRLETKWTRLLKIREVVTKALELARKAKLIGNSLEAKVSMYCQYSGLYDFLSEYEAQLSTIFIVSQVSLSKESAPAEAYQSPDMKGLKVLITRASGRKCQRCWNYSPQVGANTKHPSLCPRCIEVIDEYYNKH